MCFGGEASGADARHHEFQRGGDDRRAGGAHVMLVARAFMSGNPVWWASYWARPAARRAGKAAAPPAARYHGHWPMWGRGLHGGPLRAAATVTNPPLLEGDGGGEGDDPYHPTG